MCGTIQKSAYSLQPSQGETKWKWAFINKKFLEQIERYIRLSGRKLFFPTACCFAWNEVDEINETRKNPIFFYEKT